MHLYKLQRTQILPISMEEAWDFLSNPAGLPEITPPHMKFAMPDDAPDRIYPGLILTYLVCPFPAVELQWVSEITQVEEPCYFIDEQRFGPYKFWHHQHHIRPVEGGVEMEDIIHYGLPFGFLGRIVHSVLVGRQLRAIFDYRHNALIRKFGQLPQQSAIPA